MNHPDWFTRVPHDLRDPLSPLQTAVFLLRRGEMDADEQARMLEVIDRQTLRLVAMIDQLSDCLRAEGGRLMGPPAHVDLATLAMNASTSADAAPVEWPAGDELWLSGDEARLRQLLRTLRELRLTGNGTADEPLVIERNGSGVRLRRELACAPALHADPQALLHAPLPSSLSEGLGLDLPLAGAIAQGHGGRLAVEPAGEERVAVTVELPLRD